MNPNVCDSGTNSSFARFQWRHRALTPTVRISSVGPPCPDIATHPSRHMLRPRHNVPVCLLVLPFSSWDRWTSSSMASVRRPEISSVAAFAPEPRLRQYRTCRPSQSSRWWNLYVSAVAERRTTGLAGCAMCGCGAPPRQLLTCAGGWCVRLRRAWFVWNRPRCIGLLRRPVGMLFRGSVCTRRCRIRQVVRRER